MSQPLVIRFEEPEWDIASAAEFERLLAPALNCPTVIIDLSAVTYIDSTCLSKLAKLYADRVVNTGYPPSHLVINTYAVTRLFSIAKFERLWPIHKTIDEALAALGAEATHPRT
ncbi:MAG TPA: STAS domain-containing protein [Candidatus Cybelea sp.]|jgi:anti-anti-sigma factor